MMSFPFGVQLGCYRSALRALIITGSVLKVPIPFVVSMQDASRLVFEADFNVVILSALLFIVVQFWIIFLRLAARLIWIRKRSSLHAARRLGITFGCGVM